MTNEAPVPASNWLLNPFSMFGAGPSAIANAHIKLFHRIGELNRSWFDRVQETANAEIELSGKMMQCKTPADAALLYQEWASQRVATFTADSQRAARMWLDLRDELARIPAAVTASASEQKTSEIN